jgi:hypothetical protein
MNNFRLNRQQHKEKRLRDVGMVSLLVSHVQMKELLILTLPLLRASRCLGQSAICGTFYRFAECPSGIQQQHSCSIMDTTTTFLFQCFSCNTYSSLRLSTISLFPSVLPSFIIPSFSIFCFNNNNNNNIYLTAIGLSPGGSSYFTCTHI